MRTRYICFLHLIFNLPIPMSSTISPPIPTYDLLPSHALHEGADRMLAFIDAALQAQEQDTTRLRAALQDAHWRQIAAETALSRAREELQHASRHIDRLVYVLASFGVCCRPTGEVVGYDPQWRWLFETLRREEAASNEDSINAPPIPSSESKGATADKTEMQENQADPVRDLSRARLLLEKRQASCERWKNKYLEMEMDRDELKKVVATKIVNAA
ncbi:hypothetical protein C8R46DRAFT_1061874, partial [Mycena filopes]